MKSVKLLHTVFTPTTGEGTVRTVRFNADGEYCLTCGSDKNLKLWNPYKNLLLKTYLGHGQEVLDADCAHDSSHLTSCSADRTVVLWDVATGKPLRKYRGHHSKVNAVVFNQPDASLIFSGSYDCTVRIWDCRSRSMEPIQIMEDAKDSISSISVSGHEILTGSVDGYVRTYDLRKGRLNEDCMGKPVTSCSFSSDGQCVLASCLDSSVRLIDKDTGGVLNTFKGHENVECRVDSFVTHTDGEVVSGSEDGAVYVWDLVTGDVARKIDTAHKGVVYTLAAHPSKFVMLTGGLDGVKLWSDEQEDGEEAKS